MVDKEFIPYLEALALKELGFNEPCFRYWKAEGWIIKEETRTDGYTHADQVCAAPTYSQSIRWFREKYNIDAWVQPFVTQNYLPDESYCYFIFKDGVFVCDKVDLLEPEEAELACLRKLIEIVKKIICY